MNYPMNVAAKIAFGDWDKQLNSKQVLANRIAEALSVAALPHAPSQQNFEPVYLQIDPSGCIPEWRERARVRQWSLDERERIIGDVLRSCADELERSAAAHAPSPPTDLAERLRVALDNCLRTSGGINFTKRKEEFEALLSELPLPAPVAPHEDTKK